MNEDLMLILKHYGIERQSLQACDYEDSCEFCSHKKVCPKFDDRHTLFENCSLWEEEV